MEVLATQDGWHGNRLVKKGDRLTLRSRLDAKKTKIEHQEDIERQFSESWMEKLPQPHKKVKATAKRRKTS